MTKKEMARFILERMNEASRLCEYNGYITIDAASDIVSEALFGKPMYGGTMYHRPTGSKHGFVYVSCNLTSEEIAKVKKVLYRMLDKGVIAISKSRKALKPTMTADEWDERNQ